MGNVDTTKTITHVGLCAGYGGIEIGIKRVIPSMRTIALCEIEAFAIANLVTKMEEGLMDASPIWSDVKTFPFKMFHSKVDILSAGYPCQPFSMSGSRLGGADTRHLWPYIKKGIGDSKPKICFFENSEGHVTLGLPTVVSDLEQMGYVVSWELFSACEIGLPHQRRRVFIMAADPNSDGVQRCWNDAITFKNGQRIESGETPSFNEFTAVDWESESKRGLVRKNDGGSSWVDRVRLLGNGVVPAVAAKAFEVLLLQTISRL